MDFQKFIEVVSFATAVVSADAAGRRYPEPETLEQWCEIYDRTRPGSGLEAKSLKKIEELGKNLSTEQCREIGERAFPGGKLTTLALKMSKEFGRDFSLEEWINKCNQAWLGTASEARSLVRIEELGRNLTLDEWFEIYCKANNLKLESLAIQKMEELGKGYAFDQWSNFYSRASLSDKPNDGLKIFILVKMLELTRTPGRLCEVYKNIGSNTDLETIFLREIEKLGRDFFLDQWLDVYNRAPSGSELEALALRKMGEFLDRVHHIQPARFVVPVFLFLPFH